jgi:hypothetical protein
MFVFAGLLLQGTASDHSNLVLVIVIVCRTIQCNTRLIFLRASYYHQVLFKTRKVVTADHSRSRWHVIRTNTQQSSSKSRAALTCSIDAGAVCACFNQRAGETTGPHPSLAVRPPKEWDATGAVTSNKSNIRGYLLRKKVCLQASALCCSQLVLNRCCNTQRQATCTPDQLHFTSLVTTSYSAQRYAAALFQRRPLCQALNTCWADDINSLTHEAVHCTSEVALLPVPPEAACLKVTWCCERQPDRRVRASRC